MAAKKFLVKWMTKIASWRFFRPFALIPLSYGLIKNFKVTITRDKTIHWPTSICDSLLMLTEFSTVKLLICQ